MSTNLVLNSDFSSPSLHNNTYVYYDDMSTEQQNLFSTYWNTYNNSCLQNGNTVFEYPDPSGINTSQFVSIQQDAVIYQDITIPQDGVYELSFYYATRNGYDINPLEIAFGSFTDILNTSDSTSEWSFYTNTLIITSLDVVGLAFVGLGVFGVDVAIAITNISLVYVSPIIGSISLAPVYNGISNGLFGSPPGLTNTQFAKLTPTYTLTSWNYIGSVVHCGQLCVYNGYQYPYNAKKRVLILPNSSLLQNIPFTAPNDYMLTFYTCRSTKGGNVSNGCNINFNGSLLKNLVLTSTVSSTVWTQYSFPITISAAGTYTLQFQTYMNGQEFVISAVEIYVPTSPPPDASANHYIRSTVYGGFSVQDRYSSYDTSGNYSGDVLDKGDSTFWGNVRIKGDAFFYGSVSSNTTSFTGPTGYTGPAGVAGAAGGKGDTGPAGVAGAAGGKGDTGPAGVAGAAGGKGDTGPAGVAGAAGGKGDTGPAGVAGAKGDTGYTGPAGPQGPIGPSYLSKSQNTIEYTGDIKFGDESTMTSGGLLRAGRPKSLYPNPNNPYMIQTSRGLEIFWNTVADTRNIYDGLGGDSTFMNYAGGLAYGGYSFQTTPGTGTTPSANPTVMFEMIRGKNFTINGGLSVGGNILISNSQVRTIRNFISFQAVSGLVINHYNENLFVYYTANGKYYISFQNGINPTNIYYSVSISGTWNGLGDGNSGMVYSVENKTTNGFTITQKLSPGYTIQDGDNSNIANVSCTEVSVSY
jgi:hypothetical protein